MRTTAAVGYVLNLSAATALLAGCGALPLGSTGEKFPAAGPMLQSFASVGALYGTTSEGGTHGGGTVFEIDQSGQEHVLHSFGRKGDGIRPVDRLTYANGKFYGTTLYGGADGYGTVFSVSMTGAETVLHSFAGGSGDGANPSGRLVDVGGVLYGTTLYGGQHDWGAIFSIAPSGAEKIIHFFGYAPDGSRPWAGLIEVGGLLYGTTLYGGAEYNLGTVFSISTTGTEKILHSFGGTGDDGWTPYAPLHNVGGTLYGTTYNGGANGVGAVFAISLSGAEHTIHSFGGTGDGANPYATISNVGKTLYGTTYYGGAYNYGTVFTISASGAESVLYSFSGSNPIAGLHSIGGTLYGTTFEGGNSNLGTVFKIKAGGKEEKLYSFGGGPQDGANPYGSLIQAGP